MKNVLFYMLLLTLIMSCNTTKKKKVQSEVCNNEKTVTQEKIDPELRQGVLELISSGFHLKYPDIPLNESFIIINFKVDPEFSNIYFSDSTVMIYYNIIRDFKAPIMHYYKGMLNLDGYNIAIFDTGGFGDKYYNADSLRQISLDNFKYYPSEVIPTQMYYVEKEILKYWNP